MAVAPAAARPRPGGGRLFIIVGVILAIVAFGAVFFISSLGGGAAIGGPTNTVVIAKQAIPLRHQITADDLETAKISVNGNATLNTTYANKADVVNLISELNISKGAVITSDMLTVKRPGFGIRPKDMELVIGRRAKVDIDEDDVITWELI